MLAAERGAPGGVYFVTDGEPVAFREFVARRLGTQGVEPPDQRTCRSRPLLRGAAMGETICVARCRCAAPRRSPAWPCGCHRLETTIDIGRARAELGYEPVTDAGGGSRRAGGQPTALSRRTSCRRSAQPAEAAARRAACAAA